jgi:hypothetical protein
MRRRARSQPPTKGWDVEVGPAMRKTRSYYDYNSDLLPVPGVVAIRLTLNGKPQMTYETLNVKSHDFEDRITTLKAEALEKASALNAVGAA